MGMTTSKTNLNIMCPYSLMLKGELPKSVTGCCFKHDSLSLLHTRTHIQRQIDRYERFLFCLECGIYCSFYLYKEIYFLSTMWSLLFILIFLSPILGREICSHDYFANGSAPLNDIVSSTAVSLQQLSLGKEAKFVRTSEDDCALVFPNDIHTLGADCSHLSFGTYKSGVHAASSVPLASKPSKSNMEPSAVIDRSSSICSQSRHENFRAFPVYYTSYIRSKYFDFFCAEIQGTLASPNAVSRLDMYLKSIN